ncbi:MAG: glucans biosynthesis glucosyltransferase MdoH [Alphaproteobacteria bacterium]|nr:glucans biosynthesis glucosyltransferase MdoH [Alphaproteobacteria bacterium]
MDGLSSYARRLLFALPVLALTVAAVAVMWRIVAPMGVTPAEAAMLGLFSLSFVWIAMWFWNAALGSLIRLFSRAPLHAAAPILRRLDRTRPIDGRTAVVMPIRNEDPERTARRLEATYRSIDAEGAIDKFDFFLLSDTTDTAVAERELAMAAALRARLDPTKLRYRRRPQNLGRKAGNIAEFGQRWGGDYDYMIVLDADSVMSGSLVTDLARLMDASPEVGIVQTVPRPILAETLFSRLQQFGARATSEIINAGVGFWQQGDANYFGHNAIIRTEPFFAQCAMPVLPGRGPLSGEIMSHDFVEAAYMRRAGYEIWNLPIGDGSYEEIPPTLLDFEVRDRRWCKGNLQHSRILGEAGLRPLSRLHLATGIMSYLSSPLWLAFILASIWSLLERANPSLEYYGPGSEAFSVAPGMMNETAVWLFVAIMAMLLLPKLMGGILLALNPDERRRYGGLTGLGLSTVFEASASIVAAPIMMLAHVRFIIGIVAGARVRWSAQHRLGRRLRLGEATRHYAGTVAFGVGLLALILCLAPHALFWFIPLIVGPILAPLLAVLTSSVTLGRALGRAGLLLTPEETEPCREIAPLRGPSAALFSQFAQAGDATPKL